MADTWLGMIPTASERRRRRLSTQSETKLHRMIHPKLDINRKATRLVLPKIWDLAVVD
jgi:hypothetical protein